MPGGVAERKFSSRPFFRSSATQSEEHAQVMLQAKEHAAGSFRKLRRHHGMLIGGLDIAHPAIKRVAAIDRPAAVGPVKCLDRLGACRTRVSRRQSAPRTL